MINIKKVTVLGAGNMGKQIAIQIARSGFQVFCYEQIEAVVNSATEFADDWFAKRVEKGKMTAEDAEVLRSNLHITSDISFACNDSDLVIEAVPDVAEIKKKVFAEVDQHTPDRTIYTSNSSYIVSSKLCESVKDPSKMCNMHFFNPALVMKTVEVVRGLHSSEETVNTVFEFAKAIDKDPIMVNKEIYGFVVNRIFSAITDEALYLVDSGIATPEDIDKAVKGALGHKMGPLETLDMTGIDLEYSVHVEKFRTFGNPAYRPATCITEMYAKGEFGRKTGKGFYEYK